MDDKLHEKFVAEEKALWVKRHAEQDKLQRKWKKIFNDFSLRFHKAKADAGEYKF